MCIEAGYKVATESSDSTRHNDPECRKRTDITVYVDGVSVDDLDYGVTDVRIGYLGSKKWNKLKLTTPAQAASDFEKVKEKRYDMVPNLHPCKIESMGRWGPEFKKYFKNKLKPRLQVKAKNQYNDKVIQQWKMRLTMGMFKGYANHLDTRVKEVMARNRVADRAYAGLKPVSDEVQERIDNFGALTIVSTVMGRPIPFSVD